MDCEHKECDGHFSSFLLMVLQGGQKGDISDLAHLSSCAM